MSDPSKSRFRLLVVGYYFMRTQAAGGHRLYAIIKYLSRKGWDSTVLTAARDIADSGESDDDAALRYIPVGTRVVRTASVDLRWLWGFPKPAKRSVNPAPGRGGAPENGGRRGTSGGRPFGFLKTPAKWIRGILSFPDSKVGWYYPLLFHGWRLLRRDGFDAVLTSGPPHSSHLPFLVLKRLFRFVWVCDFRDPWTDPPFYASDPASLSTRRASLFFNRLLERCVLGSCDRILANTQGNADALARTFGKRVQRKVIVLTNGFDNEIAPSQGNVDETAMECDFVFTGAMYPWMLDLYLAALKWMREAGEPLPRLHVFGARAAEMIDKVHEFGFDENVVFKGPVSYEESLWVLGRAKALLLLFVAHNDVFKHSVPSKLYAYLFSGRPYLALVPEGDAARILEEVGGGVLVKSAEPGVVAGEIVKFLRALRAGTLHYEQNERALARYSWSDLASRLEDALRTDAAKMDRGR